MLDILQFGCPFCDSTNYITALDNF